MEREAEEQKAEPRAHRAQKEHTARRQSTQTASAASGDDNGQKHKKKKKHKLNKKQFLKFLVCIFLAMALLCMTYVGVFADQNRTIVEINQIPENVQNAFIALEDKTFETHHGFNIIRIFGAIKDALLGGGSISGTSTITQQLARNLYLTDTMQERSLSRKITEAYYAVILEKNLSKSEILEAYLNTVNFGSGYGVQTAAQAYFSKDIEDVTLFEAAALAAMPQLPTTYALVKQVSVDSITEDTDNLIKKNGDYAYVWNDTAASRIKLCLKLMLEQGYISQADYDEAVQT